MGVVLRLVVAEFRMTPVWGYVVTCLLAVTIGTLSVVVYGIGEPFIFNMAFLYPLFICMSFLIMKHTGYRSKNRGLPIWHIYPSFAIKTTSLYWSRVISQLCFILLFHTVCFVVAAIVWRMMNVSLPDVSWSSLIISWLILNGMMFLSYGRNDLCIAHTWVDYLKHFTFVAVFVTIILMIGFHTNIWMFEMLFLSVARFPVATPVILALLLVLMLLVGLRRMKSLLKKRDIRA
ncbi:hypothetical protein [Shouchella lonarensis]|uniref:Uncharacterized protein n=1 Tax=Shouchella lonarensis TaxID=1464122 RepID=A0A1G6GV98_9BACI|nr:hypothetical protein [Shouchella lonarensis]SDB85942.1 hypothetical protein SAMN05421737_10261 [Shouchella lonarensis]